MTRQLCRALTFSRQSTGSATTRHGLPWLRFGVVVSESCVTMLLRMWYSCAVSFTTLCVSLRLHPCLMTHLELLQIDLDNRFNQLQPRGMFGQCLLVVDSTECPIQRARDDDAQRLFYSGKAKDHTIMYEVCACVHFLFSLDIGAVDQDT